MIARLRYLFALVGLAAWTVVLAPFQWLFLRLWPRGAARLPVLYHRGVACLIGMRIHVRGRLVERRPLLVVANHVSWLDIVVLSAVAPVSFVAKHEMITWPLFGWLARAQRTVFVDRTDRRGVATQTRAIADRLEAGDAIVLFAEGTTSDGNGVLAFNPSLFGAAALLAGERRSGENGHVAVQPAALRYARSQGLPLARQHMPLVGWPGEIGIAPSLHAVLLDAAIDVEVHLLAPVTFGPATRRRDVAERTRLAIRRARHLSGSLP